MSFTSVAAPFKIVQSVQEQALKICTADFKQRLLQLQTKV
jgi:hypothetical protein